MKLLLCICCNSIFNLSVDTEKSCKCGNHTGKYIDELNVEIFSKKESKYPPMVIGFNNRSLIIAIKKQLTNGDSVEKLFSGEIKGHNFEAFIIPNAAPTVKKHKI